MPVAAPAAGAVGGAQARRRRSSARTSSSTARTAGHQQRRYPSLAAGAGVHVPDRTGHAAAAWSARGETPEIDRPAGLNPGGIEPWGISNFQIFPNLEILIYGGWYLLYRYWPTSHNTHQFEAYTATSTPRRTRARAHRARGRRGRVQGVRAAGRGHARAARRRRWSPASSTSSRSATRRSWSGTSTRRSSTGSTSTSAQRIAVRGCDAMTDDPTAQRVRRTRAVRGDVVPGNRGRTLGQAHGHLDVEMQEFYDAFFPRLERGHRLLRQVPARRPARGCAERLLHLVHSLVMVSMAVEVLANRNRSTRRRRHRPRRRTGALKEHDGRRSPSRSSPTPSAPRSRRRRPTGCSATTCSRATISTRSRRTACSCFRGLHLDPEVAGRVLPTGWARSTDSSDGHHPVAGIYPITLDTSKNPSADYLRGTFDWHIDGCTPIKDTCPRWPRVLSAVQRRREGRRDRVRQHLCGVRRPDDDEKERFDIAPGRALARGLAAAGHARPHARGAGRGGAGGAPSEHPLVWTHELGPPFPRARRVDRHVVGHGAATTAGSCSTTCSTGPTAARAGVPPRVVGRRHGDLGQPRRAAPRGAVRPGLADGRCCARPCWATSRSSDPNLAADLSR